MSDIINDAKGAYALHVARMHMDIEKDLCEVLRVEGDDFKAAVSVILMLVSDNKEEKGIYPISFPSTDETPWPLILIAVSKREYEMVLNGSLALPGGWALAGSVLKRESAKSAKREAQIQAIMKRRKE